MYFNLLKSLLLRLFPHPAAVFAQELAKGLAEVGQSGYKLAKMVYHSHKPLQSIDIRGFWEFGDGTGLERVCMEPRIINDVSQEPDGWFGKFTLVIEG